MVFDRVICHFELSFRNIGYEMAMAELQLRYFVFNIFTWMIGSHKLNHKKWNSSNKKFINKTSSWPFLYLKSLQNNCLMIH